MFAVKVEYQVNEDYEIENKRRISVFLAEFKNFDQNRFRYSVFQDKESHTFIHLSEYQDDEIQNLLLTNSVFLKFQKERDKNLKVMPIITWLNCLP